MRNEYDMMPQLIPCNQWLVTSTDTHRHDAHLLGAGAAEGGVAALPAAQAPGGTHHELDPGREVERGGGRGDWVGGWEGRDVQGTTVRPGLHLQGRKWQEHTEGTEDSSTTTAVSTHLHMHCSSHTRACSSLVPWLPS